MKSKEPKKINNCEEVKEELGNNDLANKEDCRDRNYM